MKYFLGNLGSFCLGVLASIAILTGAANSKSAHLFFESLYDVPVMPGLIEIDDYALTFDAPQGRVAEAAAIVNGDIADDDIIGFYTKTLAQLGWVESGRSVYIREEEKLTISPQTHAGKNVVLFLLEPR